jgi:large repetitive protein
MRYWLLGLSLVALVLFWCFSARHREEFGDSKSAETHRSRRLAKVRQSSDLLPLASVSGVVSDEHGAPIPSARVCVMGWSNTLPRSASPHCALTNARGVYTVGGLFPGQYRVSACAESFRPAGTRSEVGLSGGLRSGVDLVLPGNAVTLTGIVTDLTGGPIAGALVQTSLADQGLSPPVETDSSGGFVLWTAPGDLGLVASADGYVWGFEQAVAPGSVTVVLTPESSIRGKVVGATGQPVAGIGIDVSSEIQSDGFGPPHSVTDEQGLFEVTGLPPGRYNVFARASRFFGASDGSVLVGLAEHINGVLVTLVSVPRISGKVIVRGGKRCAEPTVWLSPRVGPNLFVRAETLAAGSIEIANALPGIYSVSVACDGFVSLDSYPDLIVADKDITGLEWEVLEGATIAGRVITAAGLPVSDAVITIPGVAREKSDSEGNYRISGVPLGTRNVDVESEHGVSPRAGYEIKVEGSLTDLDFMLDEPGVLSGVVVNSEGAPVPRAELSLLPLMPVSANRRSLITLTRDDGGFTFKRLNAGKYHVLVSQSGHDLSQVKDDVLQISLARTTSTHLKNRIGKWSKFDRFLRT